MSQSQNNTLISVHTSPNRERLLPEHLERQLKANNGKRRAVAQRLGAFAAWLDAHNRAWYEPDLAAYRDAMLEGRVASTVNAHLSTIRSRYRTLLKSDDVRKEFNARAAEFCVQNGWEPNPANIKAATDTLISTIENALDPKETSVKEVTKQDRHAGEFLRLTSNQANRLIAAPGTDTLMGLRDTAIIGLALATGARAAELAALEVGDHKVQTEDGALALLIREGKGGKQRVVPYGALDFAVAIVDAWLQHAGITEGSIFRGFYKGARKVRKTAITVVAIENILAKYPITIKGEKRIVKPHDLRRTYARLAYESGMEPVAIQQNLGHASLETTLIYIGDLDMERRKPGAFLNFNLAALPDTMAEAA